MVAFHVSIMQNPSPSSPCRRKYLSTLPPFFLPSLPLTTDKARLNPKKYTKVALFPLPLTTLFPRLALKQKLKEKERAVRKKKKKRERKRRRSNMGRKKSSIRGRKKPRKAAIAVPSMSKPKTVKSSKSKTRKKPKYLSLKLQLCTASSKKKKKVENLQETEEANKQQQQQQQKLTKLFPLRPENNQVKDHNVVDLVQDDHPHVAFLFETATDGASTTLDGLLDSSTTTTITTTTTSSEEQDPLSPSLSCVYSYQLSSDLQKTHLSGQALRCRGGSSLVRAAMRSKEREASEEERWVSYNEVVEGRSSSAKKEQEEVTSCCGIGFGGDDHASWPWVKIEKHQQQVAQLVGLKLDNYQDILDAWSDKDPFCLGVQAEEGDDLFNPQIVPDLHASAAAASSVWLEGWRRSVANLWKVPEVDADIRAREKDNEQEGLKWEQREASMLRYKKKRQSRLFAKRIRYQVRKLNAEKRPRIKGRFVKRSGET